MIVLIYPDYEKDLNLENRNEFSGAVIKTINEFRSLNPKQFARLDTLIKGIQKGSNNFNTNATIQLMKNETSELRKFSDSSLWEIRVPPKDMKRGVFRGYCKHFTARTLKKWCNNEVINNLHDDDEVLVIFSAEIKIGDKNNNPEKIKHAEERCKEIEDAERIYDKAHKNGKRG